jgi:hypothetical protein
MTRPFGLVHFHLALWFLERLHPELQFNRHRTTNLWCQEVRDWGGAGVGVGVGMFTAACIAAGYKVERVEDGPFAFINISEEQLAAQPWRVGYTQASGDLS